MLICNSSIYIIHPWLAVRKEGRRRRRRRESRRQTGAVLECRDRREGKDANISVSR